MGQQNVADVTGHEEVSSFPQTTRVCHVPGKQSDCPASRIMVQCIVITGTLRYSI